MKILLKFFETRFRVFPVAFDIFSLPLGEGIPKWMKKCGNEPPANIHAGAGESRDFFQEDILSKT